MTALMCLLNSSDTAITTAHTDAVTALMTGNLRLAAERQESFSALIRATHASRHEQFIVTRYLARKSRGNRAAGQHNERLTPADVPEGDTEP